MISQLHYCVIFLIILCSITDVSKALVWNNKSFKWDDGVIPYVFNDSQIFEEDFRNKIINAMYFLNDNLEGCILMRYANTVSY